MTNKLNIAMGDLSFHIPEELVIEILSRLSLKTLFRFKCVSKKWWWLISYAVPVKRVSKLLIYSRGVCKPFSFLPLDNKTLDESVCSPIKEGSSSYCRKIKLHSSCHGLLLIQIDENLVVWNPLTNFSRKVITYNVLDCLVDDFYFVIDLCFCYPENVYKVVLVEKYSSYSYYSENFYVATCGTNFWVRIDVRFTVENVFPGPFFKGYRHWISKGRSSPFSRFRKPERIFYFEPSEYMFIEVPRPQPKEGNIDNFLSLGVYDGCLCVTRWDDPGNYQGNVELVVMKQYENGYIWEVVFVFLNTPEFHCFGSVTPLLKTKEDELLVSMKMGYSRPSVKAYDKYGNFIRDIWVATDDFSCEIIFYEESWFSPTWYNWEQYPHKICDSGSNFSDTPEEIVDDDGEDFDYEELENYVEEDFPQRKKKRKKKMEKKSHRNKIITATVEIQTKRKARKRNKRNYESKRGDIIFY